MRKTILILMLALALPGVVEAKIRLNTAERYDGSFMSGEAYYGGSCETSIYQYGEKYNNQTVLKMAKDGTITSPSNAENDIPKICGDWIFKSSRSKMITGTGWKIDGTTISDCDGTETDETTGKDLVFMTLGCTSAGGDAGDYKYFLFKSIDGAVNWGDNYPSYDNGKPVLALGRKPVTTIDANEAAGQTVISLSDKSAFTDYDVDDSFSSIVIVLDNGDQHYSYVNNIDGGGNDVTIVDALPSSASSGNTVYLHPPQIGLYFTAGFTPAKVGGDRRLVLAEYGHGSVVEYARVSSDSGIAIGDNWDTVFGMDTDIAGSLFHFHGVRQSPSTGYIYFIAGDNDNSNVWKWDGASAIRSDTHDDALFTPSNYYRFTDITFSGGYVYGGHDMWSTTSGDYGIIRWPESGTSPTVAVTQVDDLGPYRMHQWATTHEGKIYLLEMLTNGEPSDSGVEVDGNHSDGDSTITMSGDVSSWENGDVVLMKVGAFEYFWYGTVNSVSGQDVTLYEPLPEDVASGAAIYTLTADPFWSYVMASTDGVNWDKAGKLAGGDHDKIHPGTWFSFHVWNNNLWVGGIKFAGYGGADYQSAFKLSSTEGPYKFVDVIAPVRWINKGHAHCSDDVDHGLSAASPWCTVEYAMEHDVVPHGTLINIDSSCTGEATGNLYASFEYNSSFAQTYGPTVFRGEGRSATILKEDTAMTTRYFYPEDEAGLIQFEDLTLDYGVADGDIVLMNNSSSRLSFYNCQIGSENTLLGSDGEVIDAIRGELRLYNSSVIRGDDVKEALETDGASVYAEYSEFINGNYVVLLEGDGSGEFYNCAFFGGGVNSLKIRETVDTKGRNNLFAGCDGSYHVVPVSSGAEDWDTNFFDTTASPASAAWGSTNELTGIQKFRNASSYDFRLKKGPCVDSGVSVYDGTSAPVIDLSGNQVSNDAGTHLGGQFGDEFDIGPYEYLWSLGDNFIRRPSRIGPRIR